MFEIEKFLRNIPMNLVGARRVLWNLRKPDTKCRVQLCNLCKPGTGTGSVTILYGRLTLL